MPRSRGAAVCRFARLNLIILIPALLIASCGGGRRVGPAPDGVAAVERLQPGDHDVVVMHEGRARNYLVHVPGVAASAEALPVLLAFHGGGGNPGQFKRSAGLDEVADREGFIAVYPAGTGLGGFLLTWNAGTDCCGRARALGVDDVGFTRAVLDDLSRRLSIDRSRVYATGHSNGAGMTYRLAAEAPDLLAAIAPVAGASMGIPRASARPIPLLHIHSVDDPRALYDGGLGPPFPGTDNRVEHRSVQEDLAFWIALNGCEGDATIEDQREGRGGDVGQRAEKLVWSCQAGSQSEHWRLWGVGHGWPGASERPVEILVGPHTSLLSAAEEVWSFVSRFSR
jgi:polyhydroxybutyrate depolymerase